MSFVITAVVVAAGVTARGQYIAGKQQEIQYKEQAKQERIAAEGRELQRRQELNRALAAQVVGQAGSGITGEGTPASIALKSAKYSSISEGMVDISEKLKQAQLRRAGKYAKQTGYLQAASTLLQGGAKAVQLGAKE